MAERFAEHSSKVVLTCHRHRKLDAGSGLAQLAACMSGLASRATVGAEFVVQSRTAMGEKRPPLIEAIISP